MKKLFVFILPLFLVLSCGKGPETVTVKSGTSELVSAPDSVSAYSDSAAMHEDFVHIKIGELDHIESLDPLFASSNSDLRVINLLYDGLTQLDVNGEIQPALAKRWAVNDDSTEFIFHLRTTVFFQDSDVFQSGNGRRFLARDVSYSFQRMAHNNVPDLAAKKFMDIRGFAPYYNEQTYVKNPTHRVIESIDGIRVRNDSTVIFYTTRPAPDLLKRLAHPSAVIYAQESVLGNGNPIQKAAGTGPFRFLKKEGNALLLTSNNNYFKAGPKINRLDIVSGLEEKDLFQEFARNNLDALIELGPATVKTIADSAGNLLTSYYQNYQLQKTSTNSIYNLNFNLHSGQSQEVQEFLKKLNTSAIAGTKALGSIRTFPLDPTKTDQNGSVQDQLVLTHSEHAAERYLLDKMAVQASSMSHSVTMSPSYALSDNITFSTLSYPGTEIILSWKYPVYVLSRKGTSGITITQEPWNMDLSKLSKEAGGTE